MTHDKPAETETVDRLFDSNLASVDAAESLVVEAGARAGFDEDGLNAMGMAVRECMVNAVVHGNQYSSRKKVKLSIATSFDRMTVKIADEGAGFDLDALPDPLAQENLLNQSGRGIFLIRAFVDEFRVRRLENAGAEATLVKYRMSK
jgi:serine/threonine-protein kinase RsbW